MLGLNTEGGNYEEIEETDRHVRLRTHGADLDIPTGAG